MSEIKHTPGPWIFYADLPSTEPNWHIVTTANKMRVLANVHIEPGNEMDLVNARLIAAAPELLEALQYALPYLEACVPNPRNGVNADYSVDVNCVDRARAAIAKATGA